MHIFLDFGQFGMRGFEEGIPVGGVRRGGHPLKGCLSRAKTFPMQEKEVFQALPFQATDRYHTLTDMWRCGFKENGPGFKIRLRIVNV
jgi:hypothetical protein